MKSLTGKFSSARGLALLLILFLGAGFVVAACGDEEVPTPTTPAPPPAPTPAPPPAPEPEPEPEAPAIPGGLRISAIGADFIEWSWTPVAEVNGYDVQFSPNEAFTDEDEVIARTAEEISYRRDGLAEETNAYLRVRSAAGTGEDRITSDWSTHVTGMTLASEPEPMPQPPAVPVGLEISDRGEDFIEWSWDPVAGASGYNVQFSTNQIFSDEDETIARTVEEVSYRREELEAETSYYLRVQSVAGTGEERLMSDWSTHVTGMTIAATPPPPVAPAAPTNLEVSDSGDDFIEWTWDRVSGAAGYLAQFSTDSSFGARDPEFTLDGVANTTHKVSNLGTSQPGYLRVRAYVGTAAEPTFGAWTEGVRGTTDAPPPAVPLDAPGNVRSTSRSRDSVTLAWDDVDDAVLYEARQRADGTSSWSNAQCGAEGDGNRVEGTACVATGLTAGTEYDFQVRALPDAADTTRVASAWSASASVSTTGRAPVNVDIPDGGLNLQWKSELNESRGSNAPEPTHEITWIWDRIEDRELQPLVDSYVALLKPVAPDNECPSLDEDVTQVEGLVGATIEANPRKWVDLDSDTSVSIAIADPGAGQTRGLCVVRTWEDDRKIRQFGEVEVVWGSTVPKSGDQDNPTLRENAVGRSTTSIAWDYEIDEGFTYILRLLSTSRDGEPPTDIADCSGGDPVASPGAVNEEDFGVSHRESSLDPYAHYRLCIRAENDYGISDWTFVGDVSEDATAEEKAVTRPAAPSSPRYVSIESEVVEETYGGDLVTRLVWSIAGTDGTPRDHGEYDVKVFRTNERRVPRELVQSACETPTGSDFTGTVFAESDVTTRPAGGGIELEVEGTLVSNTLPPDEYYIYACARANPDKATTGDDHGLWTISSPQKFVAGQAGLNALTATPATDTAGQVTWTWDAATDADGYQVQYAVGRTDVRNHDPTANVAKSKTEYVLKKSAGTTVALRVRYYRSIGGSRLYSEWSEDSDAVVPAAQ